VFGTLRAADVPMELLQVALTRRSSVHACVVTQHGASWRLGPSVAVPDAGPLDLALLQRASTEVALGLSPLLEDDEHAPRLGYPLISRNRLRGVLWAVRAPGAPSFIDTDILDTAVIAAALTLSLEVSGLVSELSEEARRREIDTAYAESHLLTALQTSDPVETSEHVVYALEGLRRMNTRRD